MRCPRSGDRPEVQEVVPDRQPRTPGQVDADLGADLRHHREPIRHVPTRVPAGHGVQPAGEFDAGDGTRPARLRGLVDRAERDRRRDGEESELLPQLRPPAEFAAVELVPRPEPVGDRQRHAGAVRRAVQQDDSAVRRLRGLGEQQAFVEVRVEFVKYLISFHNPLNLRAMKIRKAVIPAAGLGTRFLPATKTIPKELLPIVDKPTLLYNVEEIVAAGITELIVIAGRGKTAIEDFFDISYEVEDVLAKAGKSDLLKDVRALREKITVISVRQHQALGLGHAVLCAEAVIGDEPFAVLLGDEIMITPKDKPSGIAQLMRIAQESERSTVAVIEVAKSEVFKYGIIDADKQGPNLWKVKGVVEKPSPEQAPSNLALPGRYVFTADIFKHLRSTKPGRGGEIQLSDAMNSLAKEHGMMATVIDAQRFDAGDKLGFLKANVELALVHPELGADFHAYLSQRFGGRK